MKNWRLYEPLLMHIPMLISENQTGRSNQQEGSWFTIGGLSIQVKSDLPITTQTFHPKLHKFLVDYPGADRAVLCHHFGLPELTGIAAKEAVYRQTPWAIFRVEDNWVYLGIAVQPEDPTLHRVAIFNQDHTLGEIYNPTEEFFRKGNLNSLTLFPTDQIWLARVLADRKGCIMHSAGMIIDGQGFLFVGHSEAGKSTIVTQLQYMGEILCDDRIIVRCWPEGFRIHGTWSHGDVPDVSSGSAPLRAILILEQAPGNRLLSISDRKEIVRRLPFFVVKPLVTADWWVKTLELVGQMAREVPVFRLQFDKSGRVSEIIRDLL